MQAAIDSGKEIPSEEEKVAFEKYVHLNYDEFNAIFATQIAPYMPQLDGYDMEEMRKQYKDGMTLKILLERFRKNK